ncbi:MAG: DUF3488 and DUF4129 domain-containing transglutaminase family protein [Halobacteriaceae archaeon]
MSVPTDTDELLARRPADGLSRAVPGVAGDDTYKLAALAGIAVLSATYLSVLYHVVDVVGGVTAFLLLTAGSVLLALVLTESLTDRQATGVAAGLLVAGLLTYLLAAPAAYRQSLSVSVVVSDLWALLTGFSVLQMTNAGIWVLSVTPGPVFLTAYFGFRGQYVRATAVASAALGFFVLTGDSGTAGTLLGVLAAASTLAFATFDRRGGRRSNVEAVAFVVAVMILASATVSAVPGGGPSPLTGKGTTEIQSGLVSVEGRQSILGSIRLSPKIRFVVESEGPALWRVAAFNRYTGRSWVRTGDAVPFDGALPRPPGPRKEITQTYTAYQTLSILPAAGEPYQVSGLTEVTPKVTELGSLKPRGALQKNDSYTVQSLVPTASGRQLRRAGTDYPDQVRQLHLGLPESTPGRVRQLADNVTANAETPYGKAIAIERWLERNKEYSLTVPDPGGNVVDSFLFERQKGYCVYFASAMVAMLRAEDVPARYVVGYKPGQRVAEDTWVVRGVDAHAWVEVYFPGIGWVPFDPTPSAPRQDAEQEVVVEGRQRGVAGVDALGSVNGTWTPTTTTLERPSGGDGTLTVPRTTTRPPWVSGPVATLNVSNVTTTAGGAAASGGGGGLPDLPDLPPPETLAVWSLLAVGLAAGARRSGLAERGYREIWLRWQPASDPTTDVEGAWDRIEYALGRAARQRRPGETVREYLASVDADERVDRVARLRERARYAGEVDPELASEARELASQLVAEGPLAREAADGEDATA